MKSIATRLAVVLAAAAITLPALAADRSPACKAQDDLAWPALGSCAPALVVNGEPGLAQPDTTQAVVAGASPAIRLVPHAPDGVNLELAPDAPSFHVGISRPSTIVAARSERIP